MANRLDLQASLEALLGSEEVYYQPPESIEMKYPAIKYKLNKFDRRHANNEVYKSMTRYELILIDYSPDSEFVEPIASMRYCEFDRHYIADGLHHWAFTLYY